MKQNLTCCGMCCAECEFGVDNCPGCEKSEGRPFWLQFIKKDICAIYACCRKEHAYQHCGQCSELPCDKYTEEGGDPTLSEEENQEILAQQIALLRGFEQEK